MSVKKVLCYVILAIIIAIAAGVFGKLHNNGAGINPTREQLDRVKRNNESIGAGIDKAQRSVEAVEKRIDSAQVGVERVKDYQRSAGEIIDSSQSILATIRTRGQT